MKKGLFIVSVIAMLLAGAGVGAAKEGGSEGKHKGSRVRIGTEWGVAAGISYPWMKFDIPEEHPGLGIDPRLGFSAGVHIAVKFGNHLALQPELIYNYTPIRITDGNFKARVKSQTLQVPVLFSARLSILRLHLGPVITLTDNPSYKDNDGEKVMFGRVYPTLSYTVGVGVCLLRRLLIDLRYNGRFNRTENCISYNHSDPSQTYYVNTSTQNLQLKIGFLF